MYQNVIKLIYCSTRKQNLGGYFMKLASILSIFSLLIYLYFGLSVYKLNKKSSINRVFFIVCLNYAVFSFFSALQYSAASVEECWLWYRFAAPFSFLSVGLLMHFHIAFCFKKHVHKIIYFLIYTPTILFIANTLLERYYVYEFKLGPYGWYGTIVGNAVSNLLNAFIFLIYMLIEVIITWRWGKRSHSKRIKRQAHLLIIANGTAFIVSGLFQSFIIQNDIPFPLMSSLTMLIWIGGIWYALYKYNFLGLDISLVSKQIISKVNEVLLLVDHQGNVLEANENFYTLSTALKIEHSAYNISMLFLEPEKIQGILHTLNSHAREYVCEEVHLIGKNDEPIPLFLQASSIKDMLGEVEGIILIGQDVRVLKHYEKMNASKSAFFENMSHEIRTPLNGIMGMLYVLTLTNPTEEQAEYIELMKTASDSLLRLINDILDYSKIESSNIILENIDFIPTKVVHEVSTLFQLALQAKNLQIETHIEEDIPQVILGDPFRLKQILSNLIGNAVKFTPSGKIGIAVRKIEDMNANEIKLEFVVKDTGIGIPQDKIHFLFKRFSQVEDSTTRQYGGTGLGLAICKGLVEMMNGEIWVESKDGEGSSFYFTCIFQKK